MTAVSSYKPCRNIDFGKIIYMYCFDKEKRETRGLYQIPE